MKFGIQEENAGTDAFDPQCDGQQQLGSWWRVSRIPNLGSRTLPNYSLRNFRQRRMQSTTICQMVCLAYLCIYDVIELAPTVISHLSIGEHAVDEETFQSTMRYIFSFIEKVCSQHCIYLQSTHFDVGKASGEHCRKALPKIPSFGRAPPMAGHRVLSFFIAV